ncbi:flavocytochrome c [Ilyobacter polytropus]|uniref:Flavocytochrome c n=1 Tax=Ilyobacter polytropus (strain ATCC 51220 / DSM 2926 / LMG 16218 / CuHBu1) TaxID=572544 RepID=E3H8U6_ILYPC|nr:flavocytochrome c [Ilyobacter polytropus]ADO83360.1 flavocytochrome c [Ilyobacter polytropus DSM 2926]
MTGKAHIFEGNIERWDETIDVIVVGSGFAGLTAAIEAHNSGASTLVLEKMNAAGGNSIISDGGIAAPGTELQKKYGFVDSPDMMYEDMMKAGLGINYPELVRVVVDNARDVFQWSVDYLEVEYLDRIDIFGGHSVHRCYTAKNITGATIIKKQMEKISELGIEVRFKSYLKNLVVDSNERVCGVVVREDYDYKDPEKGKDRYIKAEKGVILATGGFGADVDFRSSQDPRLTGKIGTTNKPFATSEVIKESINIGAMPVQLSHIQLGPWASPDEAGYGVGPMFSEYIVFQYGVIVDPAIGKRFVNELADRKTLSDKLLSIGHPCIGIADSKAVREAGWNIDSGLKRKVVRKFDSLEEVANFYGISAKEIKETIDRFNENFKEGVDRDFGKPLIENSSPICEAPYYAMRLWPKVHFTMGGIRIDADARVISIEGDVIKGLYAAGEVTGGVHGASRLGSCAITECMVFGKIAGKNIVNQIKI